MRNFDHDQVGRIVKCRHEDGNAISGSYDNASRLTKEEWLDSGMTQIYSFQYDYDAVGNRTYEKRGDTSEIYFEFNGANAVVKGYSIAKFAFYDVLRKMRLNHQWLLAVFKFWVVFGGFICQNRVRHCPRTVQVNKWTYILTH